MPINHFIQPHNEASEQTLVEELIIEAIQINGVDVYYLPMTRVGEDALMNEISYARFKDAYTIEVYIKSYSNFEGDGNFLSKFGLEVRDQIEITMARRRFQECVGQFTQDVRPKEGDLVYVPMIEAVYEIKYVETAGIFYQFGKLQTYDITLELYEYSNEVFETGIEELDKKYNDKSTNISPDMLLDETGDPILNENGDPLFVDSTDVPSDPFADNEVIEQIADEVQDFTEDNPYGEA